MKTLGGGPGWGGRLITFGRTLVGEGGGRGYGIVYKVSRSVCLLSEDITSVECISRVYSSG